MPTQKFSNAQAKELGTELLTFNKYKNKPGDNNFKTSV